MQQIFTDTLAVVGTQEGRVLAIHIDASRAAFQESGEKDPYRIDGQEQSYQCVLKSRPGLMFGEIRGLSVQEDGALIVASSSSGEVASFELLKHFE